MMLALMVCLLVLLAVLALYILRSKLIWDQILAFNVSTNIIIILIILYTTYQMDIVLIDTALVFALLSFIGGLFLITFIYKRGDL